MPLSYLKQKKLEMDIIIDAANSLKSVENDIWVMYPNLLMKVFGLCISL